MIEVIAVDLDRTLLRDNNTMSGDTVQALRKCKESGKQIVIATARQFLLTERVVPEEFGDGYWICSNGAKIYKGGKAVARHLIPESSLRHILNCFEKEAPSCPLALVTECGMLTNQNIDHFLEGLGFKKYVNYEIVDFSKTALHSVEKIMFGLGNPSRSEIYEAAIPADCTFTSSFGVLGEINHKCASKLNALEYILNEIHCTFEKVIAFGDDMSDIEMLRKAKIGVAMGNAVPEAKSAADLVTSSNNEDGVSHILKMLV